MEIKRLTKNFGNPESWTLAAYEKTGGYQMVKKAFAMDPEAIIELVKQSGLRGRGSRPDRFLAEDELLEDDLLHDLDPSARAQPLGDGADGGEGLVLGGVAAAPERQVSRRRLVERAVAQDGIEEAGFEAVRDVHVLVPGVQVGLATGQRIRPDGVEGGREGLGHGAPASEGLSRIIIMIRMRRSMRRTEWRG